MPLEDESFDDFARSPATVFDRAVIESAIGWSFEFEQAAVGLEFGEVLFGTQVGGLEGLEGELVQLDGAGDVELGFFLVDRGVAFAIS